MRTPPLALVAALFACGPRPSARAPTPAQVERAYDALADRLYWGFFEFDPADGVELGWHKYDGRLPDRAPGALRAEIARLEQAERDLTAIPAADLSPPKRLERDVLLTKVRSSLFDLVDLDVYHKNPMAYSGAIALSQYVIRDYASLSVRAEAVTKVCQALPAYLAQARANLDPHMPLTFVQTALLQTRGRIDFISTDLRRHFNQPGALADPEAFNESLDLCVSALADHAEWLEQHTRIANDDYALGEQRFLAMLEVTQGVHADLATLERLAEADLERNTAAITAAAHELDPDRPVADVIREAADDKPEPDQVLAEATSQAAELRQFILDHRIATIPSDETASVRPSPPFQRYNFAFLDAAGPFEEKALASYYYISPPDPSWPAEEQRAYLAPRADLFFTTAHELWPGHFLHHLHRNRNPSRILKSFCTYSSNEGWAHYTEEMMYDAGAGGQTPRQHIGQLKEALLRDVRFLVAIGEHTHGMTVAQATAMFQDKAFVDPGNARQQAVRGTFDPMFLSYTLGKLMIMKLREDWKAKQGAAYSLAGFHDAYLENGCAPIPLIRRDMLGDDSGPVL
jgi:uncharacterized protein (DUF885 family)